MEYVGLHAMTSDCQSLSKVLNFLTKKYHAKCFNTAWYSKWPPEQSVTSLLTISRAHTLLVQTVLASLCLCASAAFLTALCKCPLLPVNKGCPTSSTKHRTDTLCSNGLRADSHQCSPMRFAHVGVAWLVRLGSHSIKNELCKDLKELG